MRRHALLLPALLGLAGAAPAPPPATPGPVPAVEQFGPWLLTCSTDPMTDRAQCRLTLDRPVEPAREGQGPLALEVAPRRGRMVPVVTARDLALDNAMRGLLALTGTVQMRFPPNPFFEMPCGLEGRSVVCAPRPEDAARAAQELAAADRVLVRVLGLGRATAEGTPHELSLAGTAAAIAAFRARVPAEQTEEPPPPFNLQDLLQRLQSFFLPRP
ncbi:hypothetical protein [Roseomonas sp. KE0001]|uniref:hypothetical protein n=1 Tax=Roseomonas sp. KE0001 TaxID=2479201 RepID=UPI0018E053D7|nr:hypothetical protein [Roseomonas sp. KE0001]MBI0434283.1 hypothetical protein [Roseomonas sp. KE0001]